MRIPIASVSVTGADLNLKQICMYFGSAHVMITLTTMQLGTQTNTLALPSHMPTSSHASGCEVSCPVCIHIYPKMILHLDVYFTVKAIALRLVAGRPVFTTATAAEGNTAYTQLPEGAA